MIRAHRIDITAVTGLLLGVALVFNGYMRGTAAPPWDFWTTYTTTAYSWWDLGSFFSPPSYLPYLFGGFPAHIAVQASGWYLPVGLATLVSDYTPHTAAVVQALTVGFGVVGIYVLARSLKLSPPAAVLAGLGYLFSPGFFGNAQHIDILRAWAFFPWLLLALRRPRKVRAWQIPIAALLWFQFFVGAYPGTIASAAYLCAVWAFVLLVVGPAGWHRSLQWLALTLVPGALLASIKWLPFLVGASSPPQPGNTVDTTLGTISTAIYPFVGANLPNDPSSVSFFVVSTLLICSFFAHRIQPLVAGSLALIGAGLFLGVDLFGWQWQELLPLLDFSRQRTADFRMGIVAGVVLLGAAGAQYLLAGSFDSNSARWWRQRLIAATAVVGLLLVAGAVAEIGFTKIIRGLAWVFLAVVAIAGAIWLRRRGGRVSRGFDARWSWLPVAGLIAVTGVIGIDWARSSADAWNKPLVEREIELWGMTANELIAEQSAQELRRRPARSGPAFPVPPLRPGDEANSSSQMLSARYNSAEYLRMPSVAGYANLKGQPIFEQMMLLSREPEGVPFFYALQQESLAWIAPAAQATGVESTLCLYTESCLQPGLEVTFWSADRITVAIPPISIRRPQHASC